MIDLPTALLIGHIFGVALGAGGAFASDMMFFLSVSDRKFSKADLLFMKYGSRMVWTGLGILFLSGLGLFLQEPTGYLASSKFLAKITIVGIIAINGLVFHFSHMPRFHRHADTHYPDSAEFVRHSRLLMASGAISGLSWSVVIVLGVLRGLPYSYPAIMAGYFVLAAGAIGTALLVRKRLLGLTS